MIFIMNYRKPVLLIDYVTVMGRFYSRSVVEESVQKVQDDIRNRRFLGTFRPERERGIVEFDIVSHVTVDLTIEGNTLVAEIETLDTPHGRVLKQLIEARVHVGLLPCGVGRVEVNDANFEVISDYKLVQIYAEVDPAAIISKLSLPKCEWLREGF